MAFNLCSSIHFTCEVKIVIYVFFPEIPKQKYLPDVSVKYPRLDKAKLISKMSGMNSEFPNLKKAQLENLCGISDRMLFRQIQTDANSLT